MLSGRPRWTPPFEVLVSYIAVTLNHFRALQEWAIQHQADVRLDVATFRVDVRLGAARFALHPQFLNTTEAGLNYSSALSPAATGFIGWLPYRPIRWQLSNDKLDFKDFLRRCGLRVPAIWPANGEIDQDYVLKLPVGSFGQAVFGPYRKGFDASSLPEHQSRSHDRIFAEQFITGRNVKVWFWGGIPFHAHLDAYPTIRGDGVSRISDLVARKLGHPGDAIPESPDKPWIVSSLAYQGWKPSDVMPEGQEVWIEYRYGRRYTADPVQSRSDSLLSEFSTSAGRQIRAAGTVLHEELMKELHVPVLFALDGVLDSSDQVWWLEANSNPIFPPTGYAPMLASLFEIADSPKGAESPQRTAAVA